MCMAIVGPLSLLRFIKKKYMCIVYSGVLFNLDIKAQNA